MSEIQLLCVTNEVSKKKGHGRQSLSFLVQIENLAFQKKVEVFWCGEDGVWQTLPAKFLCLSGEGRELWDAHAAFAAGDGTPLPGDIQFSIRYEVNGLVYWDNNRGRNFSSARGSGLHIAEGHSVLNVAFENELGIGQKLLPVAVAVDPSVHAEKVTVHWTTDDWQTTHATRCSTKNGHDKQDAAEIWKSLLNVGNAGSLQYCVCCQTRDRVLWDNNRGHNYHMQRRPLRVLTLNLHCYQEERQDEKFDQIAKAIHDHHVDIVCLQEVAEPWNEGEGDWALNSANVINQRLPAPYHIATDWSHIGFEKYREGVAILSRYPLETTEGRYVSPSQDPNDIHARKVLLAQLTVPGYGPINVFSCHLSWWEDGFAEQFASLQSWAVQSRTENTRAALLCGDFNSKAGERGYELVVNSKAFEDQFLQSQAPDTFDRIFVKHEPGWQHLLSDDGRIDYIFKLTDDALHAVASEEIFTEHDYGRVSDHTGYLVSFALNP